MSAEEEGEDDILDEEEATAAADDSAADAAEDESGDELGEYSSEEEDEAAAPRESFVSRIRAFFRGAGGGTGVAQTYGPPYLEGQPKINQSLIEECDHGEPSVREVHTILNEGVNPNCTDSDSFMDTPLLKVARHSYTPDSVKICERLKEAGVDVNKVNTLGLSALARACMSRPPKGPPEKFRVDFITWLIQNGAEKEAIDKGG